MALKSSSLTTPLSQFWTLRDQLSWLQKVCLAVLGTALLTISAKIAIPFWPVNTSMQSFTVIALGALYGRILGSATILLYLVEGAFGLPVFTSTPERGIGLAYMVGPSGGFLLGFVAAAYISGFLVERGWGRTLFSAFMVFFLGDLALYIPGMLWLIFTTNLTVALNNFIIWIPGLVAKQCLGTAGLRVALPSLTLPKKGDA